LKKNIMSNGMAAAAPSVIACATQVGWKGAPGARDTDAHGRHDD